MAIRGTYYAYYERKINKRYPLNRNFLESGMLVELRYKPKDKPFKTYVGILLHKGFTSNGSEKLHFITLEDTQPRMFEGFVGNVGTEFSTYFKNVRKLKIGKLLTEEEKAEKFYMQEIKGELDGMFKKAYRTFLVDNISAIRVLDFKFD